MYKNITKKITLLLLSLCAASIWAQDAAQETTETALVKDEIVNVRLKITQMSYSNTLMIGGTVAKATSSEKKEEEAKKTLWYRTGMGDLATWRSVYVSANKSNNTSISYEGPSKMVFYRQIPPQKADMPPTYVPVSEINIPPNVEDLYLLMIRRNESISFHLLNVSPKDLPKGQLVLMNMSRTPVKASLGDGVPANLKVGASAVLKPKKTFGRNDNFANLLVAYVEENEWRVAIRSPIALTSDDKRQIVILFSNSNKLGEILYETLTY